MKFKINNNEWEIIMCYPDTLKQMYEEAMEEKAYYVFGLTQKSTHEIYINNASCINQQIRTLKHELTHCYIWEHGLYYVDNVNEEVICDLVSASNDFINEVTERFKKEMLKIGDD